MRNGWFETLCLRISNAMVFNIVLLQKLIPTLGLEPTILGRKNKRSEMVFLNTFSHFAFAKPGKSKTAPAPFEKLSQTAMPAPTKTKQNKTKCDPTEQSNSTTHLTNQISAPQFLFPNMNTRKRSSWNDQTV